MLERNRPFIKVDVTENINQKFDTIDQKIGEHDSQFAKSKNNFKPSWSVWEEFDQRGVNVRWFGAVADANYYDEVNKKYYADESMTIPATDNRPAFQAAVNFLSSIGGGTLYVPAGTYCFRGSVIWKTKVSMIGSGISNTKFVVEGELFDLIKQTSYSSTGSDVNNLDAWLEDCRFENFECDLIGLTSQGESVNGKALFMLYMKRARFHNLLLKNTIGTALGCDFLTETVIDNIIVYNAGRNWGNPDYHIYGIGQSGIGIGTSALPEETVVVSNCHVYNCGNYGIFVEIQDSTRAPAKFAKIINCHVEGNNHGIGNKGSGATLIDGCSVLRNRANGIYLSEFASGDQIVNCNIQENGENGILIAGAYKGDALIANNNIEANAKHGIEVKYFTGNTIKYINLLSNKIHKNGYCGVMIDVPHKNINIKNNEIFNNGVNAHNEFSNKGLYLDSVDGVSIIGNTLFDDQETKTQITDLYVGKLVKNYYIEGNSFDIVYIDPLATQGTIVANKGLYNSAKVINRKRINVSAASTIDATDAYRIVINSGSGTTITNITGVVDGQEIWLLNALPSPITLQHGGTGTGNIRLKDGTNVVLNQYESITLLAVGSTWYQKN